MFKDIVRLRRRHKSVSSATLIVLGLLLMLICVPFWALAALLGLVLTGLGVACLIIR